MTKSKITQFFTNKVIVVGAEDDIGTPAEIHPQRLLDETGAIQVEISADPNSLEGKIVLEGKIDASGTYVEVASIVFDHVELDGVGSYPASVIIADVDILPYMRAALRADEGTFDVTGFTMSFWLME